MLSQSLSSKTTRSFEDLLVKLPAQDYQSVHDESTDKGDIDTSLLFRQSFFEMVSKPIFYVLHLRYTTRAIYQAPLKGKKNNAAHFLCQPLVSR